MDLQEQVRSHVWYHTMELAPGVVTPGWFDLRKTVDRYPWPDLTGKRCLDIGTFDGYLAFEMERRGAAEVVALDVENYHQIDWPARHRERAPVELERTHGKERGRGFAIASEAYGSNVKRVTLPVYDLSPDRVGMFDLIMCGSILMHLRDPILALERMRTVCSGQLLATEGIDPYLTMMHPKLPVLQVRGGRDEWTTCNKAGLLRLIHVAGFKVEKVSKPYALGYGPGHTEQLAGEGGVLRNLRRKPRRAIGALGRTAVRKVVGGDTGALNIAVLARPDI
jgi:tRNA (mo5U34)-methyltransferase